VPVADLSASEQPMPQNGQPFNFRISFEGKSLSVVRSFAAGALVMRLLRILIVMLAENAVSPMSAAREHDAFTGGFANFPVPNHFVD